MNHNQYKIIQSACQMVTFNTSDNTISARKLGYDNIMLYSSQDCYVSFGVNSPTAARANGSLFVPAQTYFELVSSPEDSIAVIGDTAAGNLYVYAITD